MRGQTTWGRSDHKSPELPCWLKVLKNALNGLNLSSRRTQLALERLRRTPCPWEWRGCIRCACRALIRPIKSAPFIPGGLWTSLYRCLFRQYSPDWPYKPNDWHQRQTAGTMRDRAMDLVKKEKSEKTEWGKREKESDSYRWHADELVCVWAEMWCHRKLDASTESWKWQQGEKILPLGLTMS